MQKSAAGVGGPPATAAPTGCFKCGRPGHWSRDCPFSPSTNNDSKPIPNPPSSKFPPQNSSWKPTTATATATAAPAAKKAPKTRPKLTPDLLLSDDGLGYVLRHFPRNFKYHGHGHEVTDLRNLIGMYAQWHSRLIPYYSFDQFVHKVEQVGATKRVRRCVAELRERVARGGDPTKLHEPPVEQVAPDCEQEDIDMGNPVADKEDPLLESQVADDIQEKMFDEIYREDPPLESYVADDIQEEMFDEIYRKATEEPGPSQQEPCQAAPEATTERRCLEERPDQATDSSAATFSKIQLTEEQRARIEANRLKALERAAARARSLQIP